MVFNINYQNKSLISFKKVENFSISNIYFFNKGYLFIFYFCEINFLIFSIF